MDGVHSSKRRPLPVNHADRNGSILIIGLCVVIFITVVFILFKKTKTGERHIAEYLHARREVAEDQDRANRRR